MTEPAKAYLVEKIEHIDRHPSTMGSVVAYSDDEVDFIKGHWDDSTYGRYCRVTEVYRDLRYVQKQEFFKSTES